jgi:hypothetical protein
VTTLVAVRDDQLIHPDTEVVIRSYLPGAESEIVAVLARTRVAIARWGVTNIVPLTGGSRSAVVAGDADGVRVVVKVPLIGSALDEAQVLSVMPKAPIVLDVTPAALLLGYIDGVAVQARDGVHVAEALAGIFPMRGADTSSFMPWRTYLYDRINEFGGRIIERSSDADLVALASQVLADLPELTSDQPVVASHGDLQGRNLLATTSGVRVLDPTGILAPSAWEAAFSAMSVVARGGDPTPVLETARLLGVGDVGEWSRVAAVAIVGSADKSVDAKICARVLASLD